MTMPAALIAARRGAALLWFARRFLPPEAAAAVRRAALGVALLVLVALLSLAAVASLLATGVVAALGEAWQIPLAIAGGLGLAAAVIAGFGARWARRRAAALAVFRRARRPLA
jgi:hypothetical protein